VRSNSEAANGKLAIHQSDEDRIKSTQCVLKDLIPDIAEFPIYWNRITVIQAETNDLR